jgi:hypothetical protein
MTAQNQSLGASSRLGKTSLNQELVEALSRWLVCGWAHSFNRGTPGSSCAALERIHMGTDAGYLERERVAAGAAAAFTSDSKRESTREGVARNLPRVSRI